MKTFFLRFTNCKNADLKTKWAVSHDKAMVSMIVGRAILCVLLFLADSQFRPVSLCHVFMSMFWFIHL